MREKKFHQEETAKKKYNRVDVKDDTIEETLIAIDLTEAEIEDYEKRLKYDEFLDVGEIYDLEQRLKEKKKHLIELNKILNRL